MTILNVAYPLAPVHVDAVGGAEQTVVALDREIESAGHRSMVIAMQGSVTRGMLIPAPAWQGLIDDTARRRAAREHRRLISAAIRQFPVDVVHLHGLDFFDYLPEENVPCVATLHLSPQWYPPGAFEIARPHTTFVCVSSNQRRRCPRSRVPVRIISQGIDLESYSRSPRRGGYALMLGRICPEKGFHCAIEAAESAGVPLVIAGQVYPYAAHQEYFRREIAPRLNSRIRFIGSAGLLEKRRLLAAARCLLIPSTVAETSSLVAMEALASGTPVIAYDSGALPEIVEHEKTGFIVSDAAEMAAAIQRVLRISPADCRRAAVSRFSLRRMVNNYWKLYAEMIRDLRREPARPIIE